MSRSRALVDLTLDSENEGHSTSRPKPFRSSCKTQKHPAQNREVIQREKSAELVDNIPGQSYGVSKLRTSINTRETAFDLTADDDEVFQPQIHSFDRSDRVESNTPRAAAIPSGEATVPIKIDASRSFDPSQQKQNASATPKQGRGTPLKASPSLQDREQSVPFRQPLRIPSSPPEKSPSPRPKHDIEANASHASEGHASQQTARGPVPASSLSIPNHNPVQNSAPRSNESHGELFSNELRTIQYGTRSAAKATSPCESPAMISSLGNSKRISNSEKLPPKDRLLGQMPAHRSVSASTKESDTRKAHDPSAVPELRATTQDPAKSHSEQDRSQPGSQQDDSAGFGSQTNRNLDAHKLETAIQADRATQASEVPISESTTSAASSQAPRSEDTDIPLLQNKDMPATSERAMGAKVSSLVPATIMSHKMLSTEFPTSLTSVQAMPLGDRVDNAAAEECTIMNKVALEANPGGLETIHNGAGLWSSLSQSALEDSMRRILNELREDHEYFMKSWLGRARRACDKRATVKDRASSALSLDHTGGSMTVAAQYVQNESPFAAMRPLELSIAARGTQLQPSTARLQQQIFKPGKPGKSEKPFINVPVDVYTSDAVLVPPYLSYISIRRNVLAENDRSLKYYPYFGEEGQIRKSGLEKELEDRFNNRIKDLPLRHWYSEQADKLGPYAARYLEHVGCQMTDVLYLLLDTDRLTQKGKISASGNMRRWHMRCFAIDSDRSNKKWQGVFGHLRRPVQQALARADLACRAFYNTTKLSLWYIVKSHEIATSLLNESQRKKSSPSGSRGLSTYTGLGCLVCHVHDCPCHGEYEEPNGDNGTNGRNSKSKGVSHSEESDSDSDNGLSHNLRRRVVAEPLQLREHKDQRRPVAYNNNDVISVHDFLGLNADGTVTGSWNRTGDRGNPGFADADLCSSQCFWKKANRSTRVSKWDEDELELLRTLLPAHVGSRRGPCMMTFAFSKPCEEVFNMTRSIASIPAAVPDEMPTTLPRHFGRPIPRRGWQYWYRNSVTHIHEERLPFRPCSHDERTSLVKSPVNASMVVSGVFGAAILNRECDPDLCGTCGACEVLDPVNRYNDKVAHRKCSNVYMQRGVPKRTLMGHSDIQGWGLYMGEDVKANEFLGEYRGEIVSKTEGDRRGAVYHHRGIEYLFGLNRSQEIDSTRAGNKMRFINNSKKHINCYPKKVFCNTVQRIGMYAKRDIKSGEELYFDYGYPEAVTKNFWDKGEPKIAASAGTTNRGKAAVKQGQLAKAKKKGRPIKHGGARSGAGRKGRAIKATSGSSGKRESKEKRAEETDVGDIDSTQHGLAGVEAKETGESDPDDSEVDPDELQGSESESESYVSGEDDEREEPKEHNPQKRGWITRKENLKRKREF
ncbi:MAG: hypothetical protein M1830_008051 [Pleopsidium flavum]|nr:MAG: hypothetical protein M1830_008051 [Pleopsidium flavum]